MRWKRTQGHLGCRRQPDTLFLSHTTTPTRDGLQTIHQLFSRIRGNIVVVLCGTSARLYSKPRAA